MRNAANIMKNNAGPLVSSLRSISSVSRKESPKVVPSAISLSDTVAKENNADEDETYIGTTSGSSKSLLHNSHSVSHSSTTVSDRKSLRQAASQQRNFTKTVLSPQLSESVLPMSSVIDDSAESKC